MTEIDEEAFRQALFHIDVHDPLGPISSSYARVIEEQGELLLAQLEQVKRELEDWKRIGQSEAFKALGLRSRADEAEQGVEYALACIAEWQERVERVERERDKWKLWYGQTCQHLQESERNLDLVRAGFEDSLARLAKVDTVLIEPLRNLEYINSPSIRRNIANKAIADWEEK